MPNPPVDVVRDERGSTGALSAPLFLSLLILSGIERKNKVNTQVAPALFNHFTAPALISLQRAATIVTNQNLRAFVSEASLPLLPLVWLAHIYLLV